MKTIHNFHSLSLRNLSEKNKRKLYLTIVRPQLLYPIIPLNIISKTAHKKLQKVQNKALRFIENTTLNDRIISTTLHARNKLPTINTYLHRRAINVWTQLQDKNPELYDKLKPNEEDPRRGLGHFGRGHLGRGHYGRGHLGRGHYGRGHFGRGHLGRGHFGPLI